MKQVHVSARVRARVDGLAQTGRAGTALAQKVNVILDDLTSGSVQRHREAAGGYTRYGEKRIKKCWKYDLGGGYRLILLQRGGILFVPFLGTHDECQRWLETNSRLKAYTAGRGDWHRIGGDSDRVAAPGDGNRPPDDGADEFESVVDDRTLRRIFCGLVEAVGQQP